MAAPPLPQTPSNQHQQATTPSTSATIGSPKSPQSPGSQILEQRISLLLSINVDLLIEVNRLQEEGKGGACNPKDAQALRNAGEPDKMASEEYIQALRRIQANLAYLAPISQGREVPPGPMHMTPPEHMPQLKDRYEQLRELFPGWGGMDYKLSYGGSSDSPRSNVNGATAPLPAAQTA